MIVFTPLENYFGPVIINYAIDDGFGVHDYAKVDVDIYLDQQPAAANPDESAPIAVDDSATTDDRTPITIDVLANDTDANGDLLTLTQVLTNSGTVEISNNKVLFTPEIGFSGTAQITYTASDTGGLSSDGILAVDITAYQSIVVHNTTGGSMGLLLGLILSAALLFRRYCVLSLTLALLGIGAAHAQSTQDSNEVGNTLYLNVAIGQNSHGTSAAELGQIIDNLDGQLLQYDNKDTSFQLGFNYVANNHWMLSVGYRHMGELDNAWQVDTANPQQTNNDIQAIMPTMGDGFYTGLGYRQPLYKRIFGQVAAEAQQWKQEYKTTSIDTNQLVKTRSGLSFALTLGLGVKLTDHVNVIINTQRFVFDGDDVTGVSLNLEWAPRRIQRGN